MKYFVIFMPKELTDIKVITIPGDFNATKRYGFEVFLEQNDNNLHETLCYRYCMQDYGFQDY